MNGTEDRKEAKTSGSKDPKNLKQGASKRSGASADPKNKPEGQANTPPAPPKPERPPDYGSVLTYMTRAMAQRLARDYGFDTTGIDQIRFQPSKDGVYRVYWQPIRQYRPAGSPILFEWTPDPQTGEYRLRVSGLIERAGPDGNPARHTLAAETYIPGVRAAQGGVAYYQNGQPITLRDPQEQEAFRTRLMAELGPYLEATNIKLEAEKPAEVRKEEPKPPEPMTMFARQGATEDASPNANASHGAPGQTTQPQAAPAPAEDKRSGMERMLDRILEMIPTILMVRLLTGGQRSGGGSTERQIAII